MQIQSTFILLCTIGIAASQSFSFSFGLDDQESTPSQQSDFVFQKLKPQTSATSGLESDGNTARGASRMASGSSRGRLQAVSQEPAVFTRATTPTPIITRSTTPTPIIARSTTPTPITARTTSASIVTRKPKPSTTSGSARKSVTAVDLKPADSKRRNNAPSTSSFSFSGLSEPERIPKKERKPQLTLQQKQQPPQQPQLQRQQLSPKPQLLPQQQQLQQPLNQLPAPQQQPSQPQPQQLPPPQRQQTQQLAPQKPQSQPQLQPQPQSQPQQLPLSQRQQTQQQAPQEQQPQPQLPPQQQLQQQQQQQQQQILQKQASPKANEIDIGSSPCARGNQGHDCRTKLLQQALACTSGKCHQCQQCGAISPDQWIPCCRDHFLCCRSLARSCQQCDQFTLTPFCNVAFGKCKI